MESASDTAYEPIPEDEDTWSDGKSHTLLKTSSQRWFARYNIKIALLGIPVAFALGLVLGIIGTIVVLPSYLNISLHATTSKSNPNNLAATPVWHDGLDGLEATWARFNGSLYHESKFRGPPNPELDLEWNRFTDHEWMPGTPLILGVTPDELRRSGNDFSQDTAVKLDKDNGGPGYMASLEMFHQLHCLNFLRKGTYQEYYREIDTFWAEVNRFHLRDHTDHCIDMIRQALMCAGDTGLVVFHWTDQVAAPSPFFSTEHKCRDPEQILSWAQNISKPVHRHIMKTGTEKALVGFPP